MMFSFSQNLLISGVGLCALAHAAIAAESGQNPPQAVQQAVKPAMEATARALMAQDPDAVRRSVSEAIAALGSWAGLPETPTDHYPPIVTTPVDLAQARKAWLKEVERGRRGVPWLKNPKGDPRVMLAGLREAAFPLDALARTALLLPEHRDGLTKDVRSGADWLVALQHPTGVFPFPVGPGLNPRDKVGHIVARSMKKHPEIVVNDWIPNDISDGGLQFDNGLCGSALLSAWNITRDNRYLDAARKSGEWAITRPLVLNWNYNAFSVGLLARLSSATGESRYLDAAVLKANVGVLPGQMPSGRWFDPHNASAVYHNILLRELLELYHALPSDHAFGTILRDALTRGLNQAAAETLSEGYTGTWTDNFARGLQWIGEDTRWRDALNVNLNASGKNGAPSVGIAIIAVLEANAIQH